MTLRHLISLSLLLLAWQKACAQIAPASDFFDSGAQLYISNNIPAALDQVESGLKLYPDDVKLKKLEELLKQQQQQQSQSQQNQQQQNQQNQQKQSSQQSQKNQQSQQQNSSEQQKQQQQNEQQKQQEQKQSGQEKQQPQNGNEKQEKAVNGKAMSPEEAKRLLDAQKDSEQFLQMKPQGKPQNQNQPIKDW
jgi:Ca-activated chloride channel family protein